MPGPLSGDSNDNIIPGTPDADLFEVQQGGNDTVSGLESDDEFYFGGALTADDIVDGGAGYDTLILQGNYSSGVVLNGVTAIEEITFLSGGITGYGDTANNFYDYSLTTTDANFTGLDGNVVIDGAFLRAGEDLTFDGSAETDANFEMLGGSGVDHLTGGAGNDFFLFFASRFNAADVVDGGEGYDTLILSQGYTIDLNSPGFAGALANIESLTVWSAGGSASYTIDWADGLLGAGEGITIDGRDLWVGETLSFDGSAESDGSFQIFGGFESDVLIGGAGNDILTGGIGADTLTGGSGNDTFRYDSAYESTSGGRDGIQDFTSGDIIDVSQIDADTGTAGQQVFSFIGNTVFSNTAGELRFENVAGPIWLVQGDTNGDGISDFETIVVTTDADPITSSDFLLSQGTAPADAQDDGFTTDELSVVTGNVFADNGSGADSDPDGPPLTIAAVNGDSGNVGVEITLPSGALLTLNADGSFTYDPNGAYEQTPTYDSGAVNMPSADTFSYTLAGGDTATVIITVEGIDNNDVVIGSEETDVLTGGVGDDLMFGLDGDDLLRGRAGDDYLDGGDGYDRAGYYHVNEAAGGVTVDLNLAGPQDTGSQGWDTLTSIEYVSGTPFSDVLIGDANDNILWGSTATIDPDSNWVSMTNNDSLDGGEGNDLLYVGIGNHSLAGGSGIDTVGFTENFGDDPAIHVSLALQGAAQDTGAGMWTLNSIENLSGGNDNDELTGDGNDNMLAGHAGNDTLNGGGGNDSLYGDGSIDSSSPTSGAPTLFPDIGANGNDTLNGGAGDDLLHGGGGNDRLVGGIDNDTIYGDGGNDYITGGFGDDLIDGGDGIDRAGWYQTNPLLGGATANLNVTGAQYTGSQGWDTLVSIEYLSGTPFADTFIGDANDNILWGSAATISAGNISANNDDYLDGAGGNDLLTVGIGNHTLIGGADNDTLSFTENDGFEPNLAIALWENLAQDTGAGTWTMSGIENVFGGVGNDVLEGDDNANVIGGSLGADQLWGYGGADTLYGDGYIVTINNVPTTFVDAGAEGGNDTIRAGAGDDVVYGGAGNDFINGGFGNDTIDGGDGVDRAAYFDSSVTSGITVNLRITGAQYVGEQGWDTLVNVEAVSGNSYADNIVGDDNNNWLWGSVGGNGGTNNDTIDGQGGNDLITVGIGNHSLTGGADNDTLEFSENGGAEPGISVALWDDQAQNAGAGTWTLSGFENLFGGIGDDSLEGDDFDNIIGGSLGSDFLWGYGGNDTLYGDGYVAPIGNVETHFVDSGTEGGDDQLFGGGGDDTMYGGAGNDFLQANAGNDILYGGIGNDYLGGGAGDDYLDGGDGWDRASFSNGSTGSVTVDLRIQGAQDTGLGIDTLINIENVTGTAFGDTLIGDDGANWLWGAGNAAGYFDTIDGQGGDDLIEVGAGSHILSGGTGIDTLSYNPFGAGSVGGTISLELQGAAQDTGAGSMTIDGFENLSGSDFNDNLTGDGNANVLAGGQGDDLLSGGANNDTLYGDGWIATEGNPSGPITTYPDVGALGGVDGNDILDGGAGNDQLYGGGGSDTASYASATGNVSVFLYDATYGEAYGANGFDQLHDIENLTGGSFNDNLGGNDLNNVFSGGDGHDGLRGYGGNDTLLGGAGDDFLNGSLGDDIIDGGAGYDRAAFYEDAGPAGVTVDLNIAGPQDTGQGMDTLIGIENVSGSRYGDHLTGDDNDNWLWGSASTLNGVVSADNNDTLIGNGGNDLLIVGIGNHTLDGGTGTDTVRFTENGAPETGITLSLLLAGPQATGNGSWTLTGIENLSGSTAGDSLTGDGNANVLAGDLGNDTLVGGNGNDTLYGDGQISWDGHGTGGSGPITTYTDATGNYVGGIAGNDLLEGGLGDDALNGGGGIDTASYEHASGAVQVDLGSGQSSGADGIDTLVSMENVIGSAFADDVTGDSGANVLDGRAGNDGIAGGAGDDVIYGGDGNDALFGDFGENDISVTGNDVLYGDAGNDSLRGGLGDDMLYGGTGNDLLRGNGGVDYFDGGADDGEGFNGIGDRVSFYERRATQGVVADLRNGTISNDGFGNVETMVGIESLGAGTAFADIFYGNDSRNYLAADVGDQAYGFGGDDIFQLTSAPSIIDGGSGIDKLSLFIASGLLLADSNGDGLAELGAAATSGFVVNLSTNTITDGYGNSGSVTGIENVDGTILADTLIGDANVNLLNGGDGDDTLEGRQGNDTLDGGNGSDRASYANASAAVTVNLLAGTSNGADGNDTLISIEKVLGSAFNDSLTGNDGANELDGGAGNDFLIGGLGNDSLVGGTGTDRAGYYHTNATLGGVTVSLLTGTATGGGQGNDTLNGIENVSGTPFADILTGDGNNNWLWGSAATYQVGASTIVSATNNDRLDGGGGNDLLMVGKGNHTLIGGTGNDTIRFTENGGAEANLTISLATAAAQNTGNGSWTISGVENLSGGIGNDSLTGDANANVLAGDSGNDTLNGGNGADTLYGDGRISVDASGVTTLYGDGLTVAGIDNLNGGDGDDFLYGGGGNDVLKGDKDNDTLYGGTGNDTMTGGQGNDRYVIEANSGADTISGFAHLADRIVFDASSGVTSFAQLTLTKVATNTVITWGNGNSITLTGLKPTDVSAADFQFTASAAGFEHSPHDFSAVAAMPHDMFL